MPDHRENYRVHKDGSRLPATNITGKPSDDYYVNPKDNADGLIINGTIPTYEPQGVHSLTDVPVFAMGPCQELFGGVYGNIDIFFNMANCLGLGRGSNATGTLSSTGSGSSPVTTSASADPVTRTQRGLAFGMLVFMGSIGWVVFNL